MRVRGTWHGLSLLVVFAVGSVASGIEFTEEELQFMRLHPRIVVGGEMDWPPMDYVESGHYTGAARDYLNEIEALTGLSMDVVTGYTWSELLALIRGKEIDMLPMMYWSRQRGIEFNLTNPFITVRHYLYMAAPPDGVESLSDLHGMSVAIPKDYAHIDYFATHHPQIEIVEVQTTLEAIDAVITGQADAVIENTASVSYYTQKFHILGLTPVFPLRLDANNVHMAVREDWPTLRDILQKALDEISQARTTEIMVRWTGSEVTAKAFLTDRVDLTATEQAYLDSRVAIVACINARRMPFEAYRNDRHEGITADYLGIMSDALKTPITTLRSQSFGDIVKNVRLGRCDIVPLSLASADDASSGVHLTQVYLQQKLALATLDGERYISNLDELTNVTLGVVAGYTEVARLTARYPTLVFAEFPDVGSALHAVVREELYGVLDYVPTLGNMILEGHEGKLKISGSFEQESPGFAIGLTNDDPNLITVIEKAIATISDSQRQNIQRKWVAVTTEHKTDYHLLLQVMALFFGALAFLYYRYSEVRSHREEIKKKNLELARINSMLEEQTDSAMHMAYHDQLTGLCNRAKLLLDLDHSLKLSQRRGGQVAVLFLDLDRFKYVNDSLGHDVGDRLLVEVASLMNGLLRDTDILCRLGGDEFIVVLEEFTDVYSPSIVAQRIVDTLSQPIQIAEHSIDIGTSIGIAVFPDDTTDLNTLIKYADSAMYVAKENGRNGYRYYQKHLSEKAARRRAIESALRKAIARQDFSLVVQPIVSLDQNRVTGAEALIRWHDRELGMVPPDTFIPIAEEIGLIGAIGEWVLKNACRAYKQIEAEGLQLDTIAINVSSVEIMSGDIGGRFEKILSEEGVHARQIEIEITERSMLKNDQGGESGLEKLCRLGHRICVDDFGTGYSSLSYMKQLPLNIIKIDRSFIQNLPHDQNDLKISETIITLSHSLGYGVVAEGVENAEQLQFLRDRNCGFAQGYFFSRPIDVREFCARAREINERLASCNSQPLLVRAAAS